MFYAVVYGAEYEDIAYFTNFEKAVFKLYIQHDNDDRFRTFLQEYVEGADGILRRTKTFLTIDPVRFIPNLGYEKLSQIESMLVSN